MDGKVGREVNIALDSDVSIGEFEMVFVTISGFQKRDLCWVWEGPDLCCQGNFGTVWFRKNCSEFLGCMAPKKRDILFHNCDISFMEKLDIHGIFIVSRKL